MRLHALRGATTVGADERDAILAATTELIHELLGRNALGADDLVSCIFTLTPDLHAEFPAVAARQMGLSSVPLMCAQELAVEGAMPRVIRVLVHCYLADGRDARHVYLGEARRLRLDLQGAQYPRDRHGARVRGEAPPHQGLSRRRRLCARPGGRAAGVQRDALSAAARGHPR